MALQLLHSEFLYILGKFDILFCQCMRIHHTVREVETKMKDSRPRKSPKLSVSASLCTLADCGSYTAMNQYRNLKQIFPEKELRGHSPNFHIHVSVNDVNIPTIDLTILLQEICRPINRSPTHDCGNWELRPRNSQKRNT
jgi:hypothetical protein